MQDFSPIKKRILQYLELKGISKYRFYAESGITRGVLDKESGISEDNIAKFIAYEANINVEWLLTGKGEMLKERKETAQQLKKTNDEPETKPLHNQLITTQQDFIESLKEQNTQLKEQIKALKRSLQSLKSKKYAFEEPYTSAAAEPKKLKEKPTK